MYIAMYKDGRYYKAKVVDGHLERDIDLDSNFIEIYNERIEFIYGITLTEELLQTFNIPNLGYIKINNGFQIFDTTKQEYTEEQLPVYVDVFGSIINTKKWVLFKTPTRESIEAAEEICKQIEKRLYELCEEKTIKHIISLVEESEGVVYVNTINSLAYGLFTALYEHNIKVLFSYRGRYVLGKVAKKPILDLYVPQYIAPMVIGKGGQMIKKIAEEVNATRINVKPIE